MPQLEVADVSVVNQPMPDDISFDIEIVIENTSLALPYQDVEVCVDYGPHECFEFFTIDTIDLNSTETVQRTLPTDVEGVSGEVEICVRIRDAY